MLNSGLISLRPLYEYAYGDPEGNGLHGDSSFGRAYGKIAKEITMTIDELQGFYLWGCYNPRGQWTNIYLGKAGFGKKALRARILEELKDERSLIWAATLSVFTIAELGAKYYPEQWDRQYYYDFVRALEKRGATHVAWVSTPDLGNNRVIDVESDLIENFCPLANRSRPVPPTELQDVTGEIIGEFRAQIHQSRVTRFPIVQAPTRSG